MTLPINAIIQGDALEVLRGLPAESISCVMTSPPYFRLRDYNVEGQIGLEDRPEEFLDKLWAARAGRDWIGIDLSPEYIEIADRRLEPARRQTNLALGGGN